MYLLHIPISVIMHTKISWEIGNIVVINLIFCHYRFYIVYQLLLKQWYQKFTFFFIYCTLPNLFFSIQTKPYFYIKVDETAFSWKQFWRKCHSETIYCANFTATPTPHIGLMCKCIYFSWTLRCKKGFLLLAVALSSYFCQGCIMTVLCQIAVLN